MIGNCKQEHFDIPVSVVQDIFNFVSKIYAVQCGLADERVLRRCRMSRSMRKGDKSSNAEFELFISEHLMGDWYWLALEEQRVMIILIDSGKLPNEQELKAVKSYRMFKDDWADIIITVPRLDKASDQEIIKTLEDIFGIILYQFNNMMMMTYKDCDTKYRINDTNRSSVTGQLSNVLAELVGITSNDHEIEDKTTKLVVNQLIDAAADGIKLVSTNNGSMVTLSLEDDRRRAEFIRILKSGLYKYFIDWIL